MNNFYRQMQKIQNSSYVTDILVGINILYFGWLTIQGGSQNISVLVNNGALIPGYVKNGSELYTMVTSMFVHIGIEHILLNMITLYFIGRLLEQVIGHIKFLCIYMLAGIFGNLVTLVFSAPNTVSAGASGAIFGIIGVWIMLAVQYRQSPEFKMMGRQMLIFAILGLVGSVFSTDINISAHLGGLAAGFMLAYIIGFPKLGKTEGWKRLLSGIGLIILSIILIKLAFT